MFLNYSDSSFGKLYGTNTSLAVNGWYVIFYALTTFQHILRMDDMWPFMRWRNFVKVYYLTAMTLYSIWWFPYDMNTKVHDITWTTS